jgi:hypothetical protein
MGFSMQHHFDMRGFLFAQGKVISFDQIFDRVTQRGVTLDQDRFTFDDSHFDESSAQRAGSIDLGNGRTLTWA